MKIKVKRKGKFIEYIFFHTRKESISQIFADGFKFRTHCAVVLLRPLLLGSTGCNGQRRIRVVYEHEALAKSGWAEYLS